MNGKTAEDIIQASVDLEIADHPNGHWTTEQVKRVAARSIAALSPTVGTGEERQTPAPESHLRGNDEIFEWLETEVSAIDTWYRGSPTYEHEAGWMKDEVLRLLEHARKAFPGPDAVDDAIEPHSRMQLSPGYLNSFETVISALKNGGKQAQDAGHIAHGACLLHASVELEAILAERTSPQTRAMGRDEV